MQSTIFSFLAVAGGGAIGAVLRYMVHMVSLKIAGGGFPVGTMSVNILGSFAMGFLTAAFMASWQADDVIKLFLLTGALGAFTTFSAFSLDALTLYERGEVVAAVIYVVGSVALSIGALIVGVFVARSVLL